MKRLFSYFIVVLSVFLLSSCSNVNTDNNTPEVDTENKGKNSVDNNSNSTVNGTNKGIEKGNNRDIDNNSKMELFFKKPSQKPENIYIKVYKSRRVLELFGDEVLVGRFKIGLGKAPEGDKNIEGDMKTPEGKYYICTKNPKSPYTLFMGISYPNIEDAKRGLDKKNIENNMYEKIKSCIQNEKQPPWSTPMGGAVGIHGGGDSCDWTFGCIGMSDKNINLLWEYCSLGTTVEIYP